ncbi:MAG: hypothetical protein HRT36_01840 [Alphaproteobacteria bacterium]|nr:hypothetical protein [Alphaproteobacteria bacterium]
MRLLGQVMQGRRLGSYDPKPCGGVVGVFRYSRVWVLAPPKSRGFVNAVLCKIAAEWQADPDHPAARARYIQHNVPHGC